jgi:hypothetical protein
MSAIRLHLTIGDDRKLVVQLPNDAPTGAVEVLIVPAETLQSSAASSSPLAERHAVAAALLAHNFLVTERHMNVSDDYIPLTEDERGLIAQRNLNPRSVLEDLHKDRDERL